MASYFSWLHLSDLHRGVKEQEWLWPNVREIFFEDLKKLHEKCGPWDLVLFTGDLTQRGSAEEFQKVDELLEELWMHFKELGSNPELLAVPGNHDLVRPRKETPAIKLLQGWADQPNVQEIFWEDAKSSYRRTVLRAFKNYNAWWKRQPLRVKNVNTGILPGDFSATIEKDGAKLGILGLNTSFLQLTDDNYEGKLALHTRQFHEACDDDGPMWAKQHHACLLLSHHPPMWLNPKAQQHLKGEITDHERFVVHLCGHMHETVYRSITESGTEARRIWQSHSLFGLEYFGAEAEGQRLHGYTVGRIELQGNTGTLVFWPREDLLQGGQRNIVPDYSMVLTDNQHTPPRKIALLQPYIQLDQVPKILFSKLPTTLNELFGREKELKLLDSAWNDLHTHIISFVAWGSVGKTALVNEWLSHMERDNYRGAERVYGWSFYSQGIREDRQISADEFLDHGLTWFGDPDSSQGSPWDKGVRLAELIRKQKTLLILDGLEPLQYPPGQMQGRLKDQGLQALLKELSHFNPGLCVITTRIPVKDIEQSVGTSVKSIDLEHLSPEAGAELLANLGVKGSYTELQTAAKEFRGHALALNLLGRYLAVVHDGEIRKRDLIPMLTEEEEQGGHARRVMESYERWLHGKPELNILYLMGLFDRPAQGGAINAILAEPVIEGLTDQLQNISLGKWRFAIKHLRDLRLLLERDDTQPDTLDCHPLVREHFGEKLLKSNPKAWRKAHTRLYEYYKNLPKKHLPDTMEEMSPLLAAVAHGCQAGRYKEAFEDVFISRINRERSFLVDKLGAVNSELALLSQFFISSRKNIDNPWGKTVDGITKEQQAYIFSLTGLCLGILGRHREAKKPLQEGLKGYKLLKHWEKAATTARHVSRYYLTIGKLDVAEQLAREGVEYAKKTNKPFYLMETHATLGELLHYTGRLQESKHMFAIAEQNQELLNLQHPHLGRLQGFQFCDLLLSQGHSVDRKLLRKFSKCLI